MLTRTNKFRVFVAKLVKNKAFDYCILTLIAISTINLAFDTPLRDPKSKLITVLTKIDYFMTSVFTTEAILKIIAYGFVTQKYGYLRNPWNLLDLTVVCFSLLAIALEKVPLL
jgi:voltage-dependent calcium channel L type alpha-1D